MNFKTFILILFMLPIIAFADKKITFEQHIRPLMKEHCLNCHNPDKSKAGLDLSTYEATLKGGSSGEIVKAGAPDSSLIYMTITHHEDAEAMPPKKPKLEDEKIAVFREWILGGILENEGGKSKLRKIEFNVAAGSSGKPDLIPMPTQVPKAKNADRIPVVQAMAVSPWAPLIAIGGHKEILLFEKSSTERKLLGALPFEEGLIYDLKFSKNGAILVAAGGVGAKSGKVVLYDVSKGKRITSLADEQDAVLTADISADHKFVAIGTTLRMVKIFDVKSGKMLHRIKKHTDWVTSLAFSPKGDQFASGDRNGGIHIWEAKLGGIVLSLSDHKMKINDLAWRADAMMLASASEDGKFILWDMKDGWPAKVVDAHVKKSPVRYTRLTGILSLDWNRNGKLVTVGRDKYIRLWKADGSKISKGEEQSVLPTAASLSQDGETVIIGSFDGQLSLLLAKEIK